MIGQSISHFEILELLGQGGMGVVYKALDVDLDRPVALKFISPFLTADEQSRKRLIIEAKTTSALDHPNICTVHEIGETDEESGSRLYIAMAFYEGETLEEKIKRGQIPFGEAVDIIGQAAAGLARAHEAGVIHRDIKPANIFITDRGLVKILDFGIAKMAGMTLTHTSGTVGTLMYMSPEQMQGKPVDQRTDVWSLGAVFYEMLTGSRPFEGEYEAALIYSILNSDPEPPSSVNAEVPLEMNVVTHNALAKNADDRYRNVSEMAADIALVAAGKEPTAAIELPPKGRHVSISRRAVGIAASVAVALIMAVAVWLQLGAQNSTETEAAGDDKTPTVAIFPFSGRGSAELEQAGDQLALLLDQLLSEGYLARSVDYNTIAARTPEDAGQSPSMASEIATELGADKFVLGSLTEIGSEIVVDATLYLADGSPVARANATASDVRSLPGVVSTLALQFSTGWTTADLREIIEIAHQTTTSYAALDAYTGYRIARTSGSVLGSEGVALLDRALELDPQFAWIHFRRARGNAAEYADRLKASMHRLPKQYQILSEVVLPGLSFEQKIRKLEQVINGWPDDPEMWSSYASFLYMENYQNGRLTIEALPALQRALELSPEGEGDMWTILRLAQIEENRPLIDSMAALACEGNPDGCFGLDIIAAGSRGDSIEVATLLEEAARDGKSATWYPSKYGSIAKFSKEFTTARQIATAMLEGPGRTDDWQAFGGLWLASMDFAEGKFEVAKNKATSFQRQNARAYGALVVAGFCEYHGYPPELWDELAAQIVRWDTTVSRFGIAGWDPHDGEYTEVKAFLTALVAFQLDQKGQFNESRNEISRIAEQKGEQSLAAAMTNTLNALEAKEASRFDDAIAFLERTRRNYVASGIDYWTVVGDRILDRHLRADMLFQSGRYREALPWYHSMNDTPEPSTSGFPFIGPAYHRIAFIHEKLGNGEKAMAYYERLIRLWSEADPAYQPYVENAQDRLDALLREAVREPA